MSKHVRTGRAQRVLALLLSDRRARTIDELIAGADPGGKRSAMWGCIAGLERSQYVSRALALGPARFMPTPTARLREAKIAPAAPREPAPRRGRTTATSAGTTVSTRSALSSQHRSYSAVGRTLMQRDEKRTLSEQLATDVAQFIAAGGVVQTFKPGESAQSIKEAEIQRAARIKERVRTPPANNT